MFFQELATQRGLAKGVTGEKDGLTAKVHTLHHEIERGISTNQIALIFYVFDVLFS